MFGAIPLRTPQELLIMREAGRILGCALEHLRTVVAPGVTTLELDTLAEEIIRDRGGTPAFLGQKAPGRPPFPATLCTSVNDEVVHGIPGDRVLREGDLISIDVGAEYQGFFGDTAVTLPVGTVSDKARRLIRTCSEALEQAIGQVRPGNALCTIGETVQRHVEAQGFSVVRDFVGHGIGTVLWQAPEVPNYATDRCADVVLEPGLVLAIEPMINAGRWRVKVDAKDCWTVRTADGKPSAHFEHTVAVTPDGHEVLTLP